MKHIKIGALAGLRQTRLLLNRIRVIRADSAPGLRFPSMKMNHSRLVTDVRPHSEIINKGIQHCSLMMRLIILFDNPFKIRTLILYSAMATNRSDPFVTFFLLISFRDIYFCFVNNRDCRQSKMLGRVLPLFIFGSFHLFGSFSAYAIEQCKYDSNPRRRRETE